MDDIFEHVDVYKSKCNQVISELLNIRQLMIIDLENMGSMALNAK